MSTISLVKGQEPIKVRLEKIAAQVEQGEAFTSKLRTGKHDGRCWKIIVKLFSLVGIGLETSNAVKAANKLIKYLEVQENKDKLFGNADKAENSKNMNRLLDKIITAEMRQKDTKAAKRFIVLYEKCKGFIPKDEPANNPTPPNTPPTPPITPPDQSNQNPTPTPPESNPNTQGTEPSPAGTQNEPERLPKEEKKAPPSLEERKKAYEEFADTIKEQTYPIEEANRLLMHWNANLNVATETGKNNDNEKIAIMQRILETTPFAESEDTKLFFKTMFHVSLKAHAGEVYGTEDIIEKLIAKTMSYSDSFREEVFAAFLGIAAQYDVRFIFEKIAAIKLEVEKAGDPTQKEEVLLLKKILEGVTVLNGIWNNVFTNGSLKVASFLADNKHTVYLIPSQGATTVLTEAAFAKDPKNLKEIIDFIFKSDPKLFGLEASDKDGKKGAPLTHAVLAQNDDYVQILLNLTNELNFENLEVKLSDVKATRNLTIFKLLIDKVPEGKLKEGLKEALLDKPPEDKVEEVKKEAEKVPEDKVEEDKKEALPV